MTAPERPAAPLDPRPRQLLERYASLVGGLVMEMGHGLLEVELPDAEQVWFDGEAARILVALTPAALDQEAEAEILVPGSRLLAQVIAAVRSRGARMRLRDILPQVDPSPEAAILSVPIEGAAVFPGDSGLALIPLGRVLARISIHAGPAMEERFVESSVFYLRSGTPVPAALEALCTPDAGPVEPAREAGTRPLPGKPWKQLLPAFFGDIERRVEEHLTQLESTAARACASEVARLDAYYGKMLQELEPAESADEAREARRVFEAEHARRRSEEESRYRVRATLHPAQLLEWHVPAQEMNWILRTPAGRQGSISATRTLAGETSWLLRCPGCGAEPTAIGVCRHDHVSCSTCSEHCGVCSERCCKSHGLGTCTVEGHAVCDAHVRTCPSCDKPHCTSHAATCSATDHMVCSSCLVHCGRCQRTICHLHGTETHPSAPLGGRWLCQSCVVFCEGGSNEPVGLDEAVRCSSCDRHICTMHQAACAVDSLPHCSRHLRRSDRSGRLVCEHHRAQCAEEPGSIMGIDEVGPCGTCGKVICHVHGGECSVDHARHCTTHLKPLEDEAGRAACEQHRSACHVDGRAWSLAGTRPCPVCDRATCMKHRIECRWCAREVCVKEIVDGRCATCRKLDVVTDPDDLLITAAIHANKGEPPKAKEWKAARDASATVVELGLGWGRRLVFAVRHGEDRPEAGRFHGLLVARSI